MNIAYLIAVIVLIVDQGSKFFIDAHPAFWNRVLIPGFFHLTYVKNTGMAWSLLSGQQGFLCLVAAIAIGLMLWYLITREPGRWVSSALGLMIGGAAGNMLDRLLLGSVRDFLDFYIFGYDFPIFNLADTALTIGVIMLMIAALKDEEKGKQA